MKNLQRDPITGTRLYLCALDPSKWKAPEEAAKTYAFAQLTIINEQLDAGTSGKDGDVVHVAAKNLSDKGIWYADYRTGDDEFDTMVKERGWRTFEVALPAPKGWEARP